MSWEQDTQGNLGPPAGWTVATCRCRTCGDVHVSVHPGDIHDDTRMECPKCHHMTAEVVEIHPKEAGEKMERSGSEYAAL